ncbi:TPA: hypothetical protein ACGW3W_002191 [Pseudomonas aeruginosa]
MQTLMQQYTDFTAQLKARGINLLAFNCPKCGGEIETEQPPKDAVWDTFSTCPHCEVLFFKVTTHLMAIGRMPA